MQVLANSEIADDGNHNGDVRISAGLNTASDQLYLVAEVLLYQSLNC